MVAILFGLVGLSLAVGAIGGALLYKKSKPKSSVSLKNRNSQNAQLWNCLWEHIRSRFNIYQNPDGSWHGGKAAEEILLLMKKEFGVLSADQIIFISRVIELLGQSVENQKKCQVSSMNVPPGFDFLNKIKPSMN
jgi:hypothetical protein